MELHRFDCATIIASLEAVAAQTGARELFVVGSMSLLLARADRRIPANLTKSTDVDVAFISAEAERDLERAVMVNSYFVEGTEFERAHGFQVSAVPATFYAGGPRGWIRRCLQHSLPSGSLARALEPHDCAIFKLSAGRAKDLSWTAGAIRAGLLDAAELPRRLGLCHPDFRANCRPALQRAGQQLQRRLRAPWQWPQAQWQEALEP